MLFYNINEISKIDINYPSIYFEPSFCALNEYHNNDVIEYCVYNDLIFVYIISISNNEKKMISPYGYNGIYFKKIDTFNDFYDKFIEYVKQNNFTNIIIRQNPFFKLNDTIMQKFTIKNQKTLFCVKLNNNDDFFNDYLYNFLNSKKRNIYTKAIKNNYQFVYKNIDYNDVIENSIFRNMYNDTMKNVNANSYYYFNENYFKHLASLNNIIFTFVHKDNVVLGCAIILLDNDFIHYHLSCNNKSDNCITFFLILEIIKKFGKGKYFNLGCGVSNNDSLHKFKKSLSNTTFNYNIYEFSNL